MAAAATPTPGAQQLPAAPGSTSSSGTATDLAGRADALALRVGARATISAVLLGAVIVILIGAQSMLATLHQMERDIDVMNEEVARTNVGLGILNDTMDSLPPTVTSLRGIIVSVDTTADEVAVSSASINDLAADTASLNTRIGNIATSTESMNASLAEVAGGTGELRTTVEGLSTQLGPLVQTQSRMRTETENISGGIDSMNRSLAYVVRILNYIAEPPTGQGFTVRADLPKETLPPIPGIKVETDPVPVFPRGAWPVYRGP